jgi:glucose/arabinose dehydrogenase/mono/diheme cytochrome c family protein
MLLRVSSRSGFNIGLLTAFLALAPLACEAQAASPAPVTITVSQKTVCPGDNGGIVLSPGFCATIFADNIGHVRHMVMGPNGVLYVNTWSGRYFNNDTPPPGGFLVALQDTKGAGRADVITRFGDGAPQGSAGGSGIAFYKDAIYAEENDKIMRYPLPANSIVPSGKGEVVLSGLPLTGDHPMHPFIIDPKGNLFVDLGTATNACEEKNRQPLSKGLDPCVEKETRGGTWRYDANVMGQKFSAAERYASGIRNGEGFAIDAEGRLFVTQHGRDQLGQNWTKFYTIKQGEELPAEEIVRLEQGKDYGWPQCYFDGFQKKLMLAPEYGGDGKTVGLCAQRTAPVAFFPAHWAPNDLLIVTNGRFPAAYRQGAFVAFHGSWNRAPGPQGGFNVVFQPMKDGRASAPYVVFADGFAGPGKESGKAAFRPTGLVASPDGAIFISDDVHGRIWRVTYRGPGAATVAGMLAPSSGVSSSGEALPPEGIHPDAGRPSPASLPVPPGATKEQVSLGDRIFHGEASNGTCSGCHGSDAKGSSVGGDLTGGTWLWGDGSLAAIKKTVIEGVPMPKKHTGVMPPLGGSALSPADVQAVSDYVWAIGHQH